MGFPAETELRRCRGRRWINRPQVVVVKELVNTLLAKARADSRLVCRREKLTGSNRAQTVCMTVAERDAARERSMEAMRKTGFSQPENRP